ncbi:MAG: OmpH family outer membrane protein [Flavobacteriales bacterium]
MKKITSIVLLAITFLTSTLFAQDKFGHIHSEQLLMIMPETADADKAIQEYSQMLETQLQAMYGEYQTKAGEFQTNEGLMTDIVKEAKIKEIQDLELRIQQFQQTSQESIQQKRNEVLSPLLEKAQNAINEVAKEQKYTYIFDISLGSIVYGEESRDIMPLVKSKLGIE